MKTRLSILLFLVSALILNAQAPFPNKDEIAQFMASKTCVVLEANQFSSYNVYIRRAVEAYWNVTPYEVISIDEFEKRRRDPAYSFIMLTQTSYDRDRSGSKFNYLNLLQGKSVAAIGAMPEICAIPLSFYDEDDDDEFDYSYKLGAILLFIQNHAKMISENPSLTGRRYLRYYNINIPKIKQKTILVSEDDLSPAISTTDKIRAIYRHEIEIVSEDAIIKAIQEKTPNTLIVHKVGPGKGKTAGISFKMLIGADDSDMYYYHQHTITRNAPDGLLPADFKRMAQ
jgi:hypothetical protein